MANSYDGDINLSVGLDPADVVDGAKKISNAIEKAISHGMNTKNLDNSTKSTLVTLDKLYTNIDKYSKSVDELNTKKVNAEEYQELNKQIQQLVIEQDALVSKSGVDVTPKQLMAMAQPLDETNEKWQAIIDEALQYREQLIEIGSRTDLVKNLEAAQKSAKRYGADTEFGKFYHEQAQYYEQQIQQFDVLYRNFAKLRQQRDEMQAQHDVYVSNEDLQKAYALEAKMEELREAKDDIVDRSGGIPIFSRRDDKELEQQQIKLNEYINSATAGLSKISSELTTNTGTTFFSKISENLRLMLPDVSRATERWKSFHKVYLQTALTLPKNIMAIPFKGLMQIAKGAKKAATNLMQMAGQKVKSGLKKLGATILGIRQHTTSTIPSVKKLFRTFIKYGFGVRSFFFLFRKIRSAIAEGFPEIAKAYEPFNKVMSDFKTSTAQMKGQLSATFAQIGMVVLPVLTRIVDSITTILDKISQLSAALMGQKTYLKATKIQQNYAGALEDTAEQAEETKRQLMGFDDVNILTEDKKQDTNAGDSGDPTTFGILESGIGNAINRFAERIRSLIANKDWYGLGKFLADNINSAFQTAYNFLTSDALCAKVTEVVDAITTTINSLVDNIDWNLIGKTIGAGINLIVYTLDRFITGIDWYKLGWSLAEGIRGLVSEIDWVQLGQFLGHYINAWIDGIGGFLHNFPWRELGHSLAVGLNSLVNTVNWYGIADLLITGISGAFNMWGEFVETFDFTNLGSSIGGAVHDTIVGIDWEQGAYNLAQTVNRIFDALYAFMLALHDDWESIGYGICSTIAEFFTNLEWNKIGNFASEVLFALFSTLYGALSWFDENWEAIPNYIVNAIKDFFSNKESWGSTGEIALKVLGLALKAAVQLLILPHEIFWSIGEMIVDAIFEGMGFSIRPGEWFEKNFRKPISDIFKGSLNVGGSMEQLSTGYGKSITQYLGSGLGDGRSWNYNRNTVERELEGAIRTPVEDEDWKTLGEYPVEEMGDGFKTSDGWLEMSLATGKSISELKQRYTSADFDRVSGGAARDLGIGYTTSNAWQSISSATNKNVTGMQRPFIETQSWKVSGHTAVDSLSSGMSNSSSWRTMENTYANNSLRLRKVVQNQDWYSTGSAATGQLSRGLGSNDRAIMNQMSNLLRSLASDLRWYAGEFETMGWNMMTGLANGVYRNQNSVYNAVSAVADGAIRYTKSIMMIASPSKVFRDDIGAMMTLGLAEGILDEKNAALSAIMDVSNAVANTDFRIPDIAFGKVTPYNLNTDGMSRLANAIEGLNNQDGITNATLADMLQDVVDAINKIEFYMGDEQIARHAQAGSKKLNRRFSTIASAEI